MRFKFILKFMHLYIVQIYYLKVKQKNKNIDFKTTFF